MKLLTQVDYRESRSSPTWVCWAMVVGLVVTVGCGAGRPELVPVSGRVLIDGKPLEYGFIRVSPANARAATGKIDKDGRFNLKTFEDGDGVVPGEHPVTIKAGEYLSETDMMWHAPRKYSRPETSDLTATIEGPRNDLVIELTWDGDKPYRTRDGVRVGN